MTRTNRKRNYDDDDYYYYDYSREQLTLVRLDEEEEDVEILSSKSTDAERCIGLEGFPELSVVIFFSRSLIILAAEAVV